MASTSQPTTATSDGRRKKDPEGRMSLGEHLVELRNRLMWCAGTLLLTAILGWFIYEYVFDLLEAPFLRARDLGIEAEINFNSTGGPLNTKLQISAYVGLILAAPMFLYQVWAFVMPGLHKNERQYAFGFFGTAIPLFFIGAFAGYWVMDKAVPILLSFAPQNVTQFVDFGGYLKLFVKTMLAFGIAFVMPVILVLFNFLGILSGRAMLKAWRWVVFLCFAFTAVMVPTPDPFTMTFMALPMIALYFAAVGIGFWHDKRVARNQDDGLDDDQVSSIDDEPEDVGPASRLDDEDAERP